MRSASKLIFILMAISFVVGFLLLETSGILNTSAVTTSTAVAEVNGQDILYTQWQQQVSQAAEQERTRRGRTLNGDEMQQLEQRVLDDMINNVLLEQEYKKRGMHNRHTRIYMLTTSTLEDERKKIMDTGIIVDYFEKPLSEKHIRKIINDLLVAK